MKDSIGGQFAAEGTLSDRNGTGRGWVTATDGKVTGIGRGDCPVEPDVTGLILADVVNMHTHCADYGLHVPPGLSLEELVAPPNGLKHRYLRESSSDALARDMARFSEDSRRFGASRFADFREGGVEGCRLLRSVSSDAVILGRPISPEYDPEEMDALLSVSDGVGIPSISDMDLRYIERIADEVRDRRMIFAIHVSERVREDIDAVLSLDPAFVVHMCEATDSDLSKCAEAEVPVVVCPTSNRYFGRESPIARAIRCGVDLGIGTDNGMLCLPDIISEAYAFSTLASSQGADPDSFVSPLSRLSKILYRIPNNPESAHPGPVTVIPTGDLETGGALKGPRIRLE